MTADRLEMDLDEARLNALDRMERGERLVRWGLYGAVVVEALMLLTAFALIDWHDRLHKLLFVLFIFSYTIVILGLLALAGHVSRMAGRVIAAIEAAGAR